MMSFDVPVWNVPHGMLDDLLVDVCVCVCPQILARIAWQPASKPAAKLQTPDGVFLQEIK